MNESIQRALHNQLTLQVIYHSTWRQRVLVQLPATLACAVLVGTTLN